MLVEAANAYTVCGSMKIPLTALTIAIANSSDWAFAVHGLDGEAVDDPTYGRRVAGIEHAAGILTVLIYASQIPWTICISAAFRLRFPGWQLTVFSGIPNISMRATALRAVSEDEALGILSARILIEAGVHTLS